MKKEKDAYGREILAFLNGEDVQEIVERDDGFIDTSGGPDVYFKEYKDWSEHDKKSIKLAKGRILDVGCGAGRNSLYLQKKGFDVIGIDNSPYAIEVCKKRGLKNAKQISIEEIGKFKPNSFDTIIMFGNNFGLFGSYKKAKELLKIMYNITSPNAQILAESINPYKTKMKEHLDYQKFNKKRGRMPGQLRIRVRFRKVVGDWLDYLIVSKKEMGDILRGTGWEVRKFINSTGSMYTAVITKTNLK